MFIVRSENHFGAGNVQLKFTILNADANFRFFTDSAPWHILSILTVHIGLLSYARHKNKISDVIYLSKQVGNLKSVLLNANYGGLRASFRAEQYCWEASTADSLNEVHVYVVCRVDLKGWRKTLLQLIYFPTRITIMRVIPLHLSRQDKQEKQIAMQSLEVFPNIAKWYHHSMLRTDLCRLADIVKASTI